ncbi:MAG: DUF4126 domain-containing protein [Vicinamibacterales bacterium]
MDPFQALVRIIPFAFASGVNLYATIAVAGVCARYGLMELPEQFRGFGHPMVIGVAVAMYLVEFVADKVPWVDTLWDAVHTVIRPVGGALVAMAALGDTGPGTQAMAALLGGSVALTSHMAKAGTRAVANTSPEPFTNWGLSLAEDAFVIGLTWFAVEHPYAATAVALVLIALIVATASRVVKAVRRRFAGSKVTL